MFCEKCNIIFEANYCPICGSKNVRKPVPDDLCFLTEKEMPWSGMIEDVLHQNKVPVLSKSTIGAGMAVRTGSMFEKYRIYVRYEDLQKAIEIVKQLFSSDEVNPNED